ncbi:MAG: methyltransferase domain-containing protein, partial [Magnetococcales bacterium]|nr:methyltransferase domain-containing protein [Magnetococcales bacterium]
RLSDEGYHHFETIKKIRENNYQLSFNELQNIAFDYLNDGNNTELQKNYDLFNIPEVRLKYTSNRVSYVDNIEGFISELCREYTRVSHQATVESNRIQQLPLPTVVNLGSGKDWRTDYLNIDCNATWNPDLVLDLNQPIPFGKQLTSQRFGEIRLSENSFETLIAFDVLEHITDLTTAMTSALKLLKPGGKFVIQVPYELSLGAWQDPTHVRAFNENSWIYYTDWCWYLGWDEARFDLESLTFVLSEYGDDLHRQGMELKQLKRQPRAIDIMKVVLCKRLVGNKTP